MSITIRVTPTAKILHTRATGIVNFDDLVHHLRVKEQQDVLACAEIFDTRGAQFDLSILDVGRLAAEVRRTMSSTRQGPVAVVTNSNFIRGLARAYAALTIEENPALEIFDNLEEAQSWIGRTGAGVTAGPMSGFGLRRSEPAPHATTVQ